MLANDLGLLPALSLRLVVLVHERLLVLVLLFLLRYCSIVLVPAIIRIFCYFFVPQFVHVVFVRLVLLLVRGALPAVLVVPVLAVLLLVVFVVVPVIVVFVVFVGCTATLYYSQLLGNIHHFEFLKLEGSPILDANILALNDARKIVD